MVRARGPGCVVGDDAAFDHELPEFAERYADRNERDYELLAEAARSGRISVQKGI